jgi:hypothetical protein
VELNGLANAQMDLKWTQFTHMISFMHRHGFMWNPKLILWKLLILLQKYKSSKINMELFMWDLMEQCAHIYYICGAYWTFVHQ